MIDFNAHPQLIWYFYLLVAVISLLIGSFLNVVIHRLPIMMERSWRQGISEFLADSQTPLPASADVTDPASGADSQSSSDKNSTSAADSRDPLQADVYNLAVPRSRCPSCHHLIQAWHNIPVLSYLILRGRCSHCQASISVRYPLIELSTMLLSLTVALVMGPSMQALLGILVTWYLIAMSMIDFDHQLLPDTLTLPLMWLGLLASLLPIFTDVRSAVIGAASGYLVLWFVYQIFKLLTGKEGMGYGDFKLLAAIGALLGWQVLPMVILLSSLVGAVVGIALVVIAGRDRSIPIPFGPYLAAAGWIAMLWGESLRDWYFGMLV